MTCLALGSLKERKGKGRCPVRWSAGSATAHALKGVDSHRACPHYQHALSSIHPPQASINRARTAIGGELPARD